MYNKRPINIKFKRRNTKKALNFISLKQRKLKIKEIN